MIGVLASSCTSTTEESNNGETNPKGGDEVFTINQSIQLGEEEIAKLSESALAGDKEASYRLAQVFIYGYNDREKGLKWMKLAASQGHPLAIEAFEDFGEDLSDLF